MSYSFEGAERVLHRWDTLGSPPQDRVHVTQGPGVTHQKGGEVPLASQCQPAFKQAYGIAEFSLGNMEMGRDTSTPWSSCRGGPTPQRDGCLPHRGRLLARTFLDRRKPKSNSRAPSRPENRQGRTVPGSSRLPAPARPSKEAPRHADNRRCRGGPRQGGGFPSPGAEHPQATRQEPGRCGRT